MAEKFTITTAHLVFFGVGKAVFNFATGVLCDAFGRKVLTFSLFYSFLLAYIDYLPGLTVIPFFARHYILKRTLFGDYVCSMDI